jgi:hypothetical protein
VGIPLTNTRTVFCYLITLLLFTPGDGLRAQKVQTANGFVIDANRPYVYLKFDHIGSGLPRDDSEPTARIRLRLTNNCRVAIIVSTYGLPEGSPKDKQGVMDDVVPNPEVGPIMILGTDTPAPSPSGKAQESATERSVGGMPRGYMSEAGSFQSVPPGQAMLFSVPINHVGKRWHFEIPFRFDLLTGKGFREPIVGGQPNMVIIYTISDLPPKQAQFEH